MAKNGHGVSEEKVKRITEKGIQEDYAAQRMAEHREDAGMTRDQIEYPGASMVVRARYEDMPHYEREQGFYGHYLPSHFKKTRIIDTHGR